MPHPCFDPCAFGLELLEPRLVLSLVSWTGAGDGVSWHDGNNWDAASPPGVTDDAFIDIAEDPTIEFSEASGDQIINSLVSREAMSFSGGSLAILTTAEVSAVVGLDGGELIGGAWDVTGGTMLASRSETWFSGGIELTGDIDMTSDNGTRLAISDGLTHHGTIHAALGARISFWSDQEYRSGIIDLNVASLEVHGRLELAEDVTVFCRDGTAALKNERGDRGTLVNRGTIVGGAYWLQIELGQFENYGSVSIGAGGELLINAVLWANSGSVEAVGATVELGSGVWSNTGTISVTNSLVWLLGEFGTSDITEGRFLRQGGTLYLRGSLDNIGSLLSLSGDLEGMSVYNGSITGGEVVIPAGRELVVNRLRLHGPIAIHGDILVGWSSGDPSLQMDSQTEVHGVIRLDDHGSVNFVGDQTTGALAIEVLPYAENVGISTGNNVIIGPETTILIGARASVSIAAWYQGTASFTNRGLIAIDGSWSELRLAGESFTNEGTIRAGADTRLRFYGDDWLNTGQIIALGARAVYLGDGDGVWRNEGQITLVNTELRLNGQMTVAAMGWDGFSVVNTEVFLDGMLDNTGETLVLGAETGVWTFFSGGGIRGGELVIEPGYEPILRYGHLEGPIGVTGILALGDGQSALHITGGLRLDGFAFINNGVIELEGSQTIEAGTFVFGGGGGQVRLIGTDEPVFVLGADVTVRVEQGATALFRDTSSYTDGTVINQGLMIAATESSTLSFMQAGFQNEGRLEVFGTVTVDTDVWSSAGEVSLSGGALEISDAVAYTNEINFGGIIPLGGVIRFAGTLDNTGLSVELDSAVWRFEGGTLIGGVVTIVGTLTLTGTQASSIVGPIEIHGDVIVEDEWYAALRISGGMSLHGTLVLGANALLEFEGSQTIDSGLIEVSGLGEENEIRITGRDSEVTLGGGVILRGGHADVGRIRSFGSGQKLINLGMISADTSGRSLEIQTVGFENYGMLSVGSGATLSISAEWSNAGTVQLQGGTLNLGGSFTTAGLNLAGFSRSGGRINITGDLDNTGQTFTFPRAIGPFVLDGGSITGGSVVLPAAQSLYIGTHPDGALRGPMEFDGSITTNPIAQARLTISGGLNLSGMVLLTKGARVYLEGTQHVEGVEFRFSPADTPGQLLTAGHNATITLGAQTSITGGHADGAMISSEGRQTLVFEGVLEASIVDATFYIFPSSFVNRGEVVVSNGSSVIVTPTGSYSGGELLTGSWTVMERSKLQIAGALITSIGEDAAVMLEGYEPEFVGLSPALSEIRGTFGLAGGTYWILSPGTGRLVNSGSLVLGASAALDINGDYVQTETGTFDSTMDSGFAFYPGRIRVTGTATLAGAFSMHYVNYNGREGDWLEVIHASGGVIGGFDEVSLPDPFYEGDQILLIMDPNYVRVLNTDLADLNLDGLTDTQDFIMFLGFWVEGDDRADINGDGRIDTSDFIAYLNRWADG